MIISEFYDENAIHILVSKFSIFQFPIIHLFAPQILHKPLFLTAPGSIAFSQEHFKTISYAKFGGQTECIMGNWKIVNKKIQSSLKPHNLTAYDCICL